MPTTAVDLLVVAYRSLTADEQQDLFERINDLRARSAARDASEMARYVRSLRHVAEEIGRIPTVDDYRTVQPRLVARGEDIESFTRVYRFFGNWPRAREALALADTTTARRIQARFDSRRLGKVWRYTEDTLRDTLRRCVEHYGRPPGVAEFEWWRDRELELARGAGHDHVHLPSANPYRKRWKTWEGALLHFGYRPEDLEARLEQPVEPIARAARLGAVRDAAPLLQPPPVDQEAAAAS